MSRSTIDPVLVPGPFRFIGVDLAWTQTNESGLVLLDGFGRILDAGWETGFAATAHWIETRAGETALVFVDAPLVVRNPFGMRECERQVGQRYGRAQVSANSTNLSCRNLGGVLLLKEIRRLGFDLRPRK